jgi:dihydroflavonol-4-reductase
VRIRTRQGTDVETLVTGASGFVGSAVSKKLTLSGQRVRALVRAGSPRFHLAGLDLAFVKDDIGDRQSVR